MDQLKKTGREIDTETKKKIRDLDGHDLGDDIGNAGDEVKKDLGNLGDDLRRTGHEVGQGVDRQVQDPEHTNR
ncbi:MAG: hypothetical protein ABI578_09525 [Chloroflexota bacterium]